MSETWERLKLTLQELGQEPKKSLGQNFLISDGVIAKIIAAAKSTQAKSLLEIGPGPGALTFFLRQFPADFSVIELDKNFADYWRNQGLKVIEADALQISWREFLRLPRPLVLVSNLPYQISSSLVIDRCLDESPLDAMVLMFQKEVAQRIRAVQGHELYGMLSVVAQTFWQIETISEAGPRDFFPAPKVASRVLSFKAKGDIHFDRKKYFKIVKSCFLHPRKLLASNLAEAGLCPKVRAFEVLQAMQLPEKSRAEELSIPQYLKFLDYL